MRSAPFRLSEQDEGDAGELVRLRDHGGGGLYEDVLPGEPSGLQGDVGVHDASMGGLEVRLVLHEQFVDHHEARHFAAVLRPGVGQVLDREGEHGHRDGVEAGDETELGVFRGEGGGVGRVGERSLYHEYIWV